MMTNINAIKTQLEAIIRPEICDFETNEDFAQSYREQRQTFLLNRLELQAQLMMIIGLTLTAFFMWVNEGITKKIYALKIGLLLEFFIVVCWLLCKTPLARRYLDMFFLGLCWSATCTVQVSTALLFNYVEPMTNIWNLMFLTQATIIPVKWRIHLIAQVGTIIWYLGLYLIYRPTFKFTIDHYVEQGLYLFWTGTICIFSVYLYEKLKKKEFRAKRELEIAQEQSERLLLNILPAVIAKQLKHHPTTIADSFHAVTVLFADIVGFTELSSQTSPAELVELLNQIFCLFDELAEIHSIEKIKTIGDAYMAVAGLPNYRSDHALAIANMALDMQKSVIYFNKENNLSFQLRMGISTGPVVAGVIGLKKFAYDLWGDTVNTASRMESHGIPDHIQICEATYELLKDKYLLEKRGLIKIKGKGEMMTYLLHGRKI
ncbi:MAG: adenylate/guanylate cyclase domain-containing protein [Dolichospermum sp. DET50]|nr:adenylate/guanylate cyclase domain-containing protein [Dolichospermum sp. DET66]MBS3033044.1 adenylate/guanylate cyclase domain-containing protein [Dolichospermum sp. DET67]MBS3038249.1 adenylate/guanylate cyclase domain-containing protein [Dolichospermum sp. DET50]QSX70148.1 MAG: adenylate/guanylate cyclase domain-containing protein [Dolichospermum sp. DET69]